MSTIEIQLSQQLLALGIDKQEVQRRVSEWLVLSLFTEERISSGKGASLLGISRVEFLRLLRQHRIAYIDYGDEELAREFEAVERLTPSGDEA